MADGYINTIETTPGCSYAKYDNTLTTSNDFIRGLYLFTNEGELLALTGSRFIDDYHVEQALISSGSFNEAIGLFEKEYSFSRNNNLVKVEYIGYDNRPSVTDPYLMFNIRKP